MGMVEIYMEQRIIQYPNSIDIYEQDRIISSLETKTKEHTLSVPDHSVVNH